MTQMHTWVRAENVKAGRRDERNALARIATGQRSNGQERSAADRRPSAVGRSTSGGAPRLGEFGGLAREAGRTDSRNWATSSLRRVLSPDSNCAAERTCDEAVSVSVAPRCTSVMLA